MREKTPHSYYEGAPSPFLHSRFFPQPFPGVEAMVQSPIQLSKSQVTRKINLMGCL